MSLVRVALALLLLIFVADGARHHLRRRAAPQVAPTIVVYGTAA